MMMMMMKQENKKSRVLEVTSMDLPLDWNNAFDTDERTQGVHFDSIPDALIHCLSTLGRVDIEFISSIMGVDLKTVIRALKGSIYQNPDTWDECFYKGWETADEYLSGNLMRKWKHAKRATQIYRGYFDDNLSAIEKVLPPAVATEEIYVTLGSPWIPTDIIDDFIEHLFGTPNAFSFNLYMSLQWKNRLIEEYKTRHDSITGTWDIPEKSRFGNSVAVTRTWGTDRMNALKILEKTMNMRSVAVYDEESCQRSKTGKKRVLNKVETLAAIEKQKKMIKEFRKWIWQENGRKERLEIIFENQYSCVRRRIFDGSFLEFPGMSDKVSLYPYQKNAVARILFTPNTLLAHDVGAGKTLVMVAAGQEMRRMGISVKNMYVVPNNIVGQWKNIFLEMYPNAKLLCVEPRIFKPEKRQKVLSMIRDGEYDGIIIAYSCFDMIPLSKAYYIEEMREKKEKLEKAAAQKNGNTKGLKKRKEKVSKELAEMAVSEDDAPDSICFDELGITRLFVDEAHNYKNIPMDSNFRMALGINSTGSKKCKDMLEKVHMIQKKNDGKGVVMATGTPITNSVTDAYALQLYLQSGELAMLDLQTFGSWVGMFAEQRTEFEIDVDTSSYRLATRFSKFHNMPELTSLLGQIADFHHVDECVDVPVHDGYMDTIVDRTKAFTDYLKTISRRADDVRSGIIDPKEDNMLKITTDGRKAALDIRLVDKGAAFSYRSKVAKCAENVIFTYFRTMADRSTQLIFCDISAPKETFNIYDELKRLIMDGGVPEEEIAYIQDADTEGERSKLFTKVRNGDVRVLIGSTFKLGLGVNIQDRLIALHHIDVPWRPADMTQREGRILRQGNMNPKVEIYRYITKGSFDAYSWQLLETKQRFISDLLSGSLTERDGDEIEGIVLDYAEVKALAVGNPKVKERVETQNELARYMSLQRKTIDSRFRMEKELHELPARKEAQKTVLMKCRNDAEAYRIWKEKNPAAESAAGREEEAYQRRLLREMLNSAVKEYEFMDKEKILTSYMGFDIVLPANMDGVKPYVWLRRAGDYKVDMADTRMGNLIRIDNFLEGLEDRVKKQEQGLRKIEERETEIQNELSKNETYSDVIEDLRLKVAKLDRELGVDRE